MIDRLQCEVRGYAWGDPVALPRLLGNAPTGNPQAEMWMGAHTGAPSRLGSSGQLLNEAIAANPDQMVGQSDDDGRAQDLPFLCKFLAAGSPLSIQVHPTLDQARDGFLRENALGIPVGDPKRTYRDDNHKPELVVAIEPFSALCGFRDVGASLGLLNDLSSAVFGPLIEKLCGGVEGTDDGPGVPDEEILASTVLWLLDLPTDRVTAMIAPFLDTLADSNETFWWIRDIASQYPSDPGVLVSLLLNHFVLEPGEGVFLPAGNVHAYLHGLAVEIMASSDNVVRGGLTPKNIDRAELLRIASFAPIDPPIQRPMQSAHTFVADVPEFALSRIELAPTQSVNPRSESGRPEIVFVTGGGVTVAPVDGHATVLERGEVVFVSADEGSYTLTGDGVVWRATTNTHARD